MIQFRTLLDGLNYQKKCPLCKEIMVLEDRDFIEKVEYPRGHEYQKLSFALSRKSQDIVYVYTATGKVELKLGAPKAWYGDSTGYSAAIPTAEVYSGILMQGLTVYCDECGQYRYTLKLEADLSKELVRSVSLNSETISLDRDGKTHEIRSIYSVDKTEYAVFGSFAESILKDKVELPLIPINLKDPQETLDRIRTLLPFL